MRLHFLVVLGASLFSGCANDSPGSAATDDRATEDATPAPDANDGPWRIDRDFNFTIEDGVAVPGQGTSSSGYDELEYACTIFDLPGIDRMTLWLNSTPDDLGEPSVGGATFDWRDGDAAPTDLARLHPEQMGARSYRLVIDDLQEGSYLVNYNAENAAVNAHARGHFILEGTGPYFPSLLGGCHD